VSWSGEPAHALRFREFVDRQVLGIVPRGTICDALGWVAVFSKDWISASDSGIRFFRADRT